MSAAALAACYLLSKLKVLKEKEFLRLFHAYFLVVLYLEICKFNDEKQQHVRFHLFSFVSVLNSYYTLYDHKFTILPISKPLITYYAT